MRSRVVLIIARQQENIFPHVSKNTYNVSLPSISPIRTPQTVVWGISNILIAGRDSRCSRRYMLSHPQFVGSLSCLPAFGPCSPIIWHLARLATFCGPWRQPCMPLPFLAVPVGIAGVGILQACHVHSFRVQMLYLPYYVLF